MIYIALIARVTRASVLETLGEDYIRTARAKGLAEGRVLIRHALANAAVPIVTVIGIGVALLIGGVVVTESVYAIPGLGRLTVDAVLARDFPTIQGVILLFSVRLRDDQPAGRPVVRVLRSADPLLGPVDERHRRVAASGVPPSLRTTPCRSKRRRSSRSRAPGSGCDRAPRSGSAARSSPCWCWSRCSRPGSARSIRRCSIRRAATCCPGAAGEITTLEGETLKHRFLMGSDSFGRDIYSRVIYGTQVSLIVGLVHRRPGDGRRRRARPARRLPAPARRAADARDGRRDGDSRRS